MAADGVNPVDAAAVAFVTYAHEQGDRHNLNLTELVTYLRRNNIDVIADWLDERLRGMSNSDWLDQSLENCDFVLVCVSPNYRSMIAVDRPEQDDLHVNERLSRATYVYRRIHANYIENKSFNYSYIPLLMTGATRNDAPEWLKDTKCYRWPEEKVQLLFRLHRVEMHPKPPLGPPPRFQVMRHNLV